MKRFLVALAVVFGCTLVPVMARAACTTDEIDVLGDGTQCETAHFSITTTNLNADDTFQFSLNAVGTFYVDCGTGGVLSGTGVSGNTITLGAANATTYTCTYSGTTGAKTVRFGGAATGYNSDTHNAAITFENLGASKIASLAGNMSAVFNHIGDGTNGATSQVRFYGTFKNATNLTSIPRTLFSSIIYTRTYTFFSTFDGCTGLTSIPADFFANVTNGGYQAFYRTFAGCTGLTAIPEGLFRGMTTINSRYVFQDVFCDCTNLVGYIPPSAFAGLIANGSPTTEGMWSGAFYNTGLVTTCPSGTTQYITGYEVASGGAHLDWDGKVSCISIAPMAITLDTTGADSAAVPATVYVSYNTGWYSDSAGNNAISSLTTLPTKSSKVFAGFYTGQNATGTQIINANGNFINNKFTAEPTTLYAYFETGYSVMYSCGDGSGTPPANTTAVSGGIFNPAANTCTKSGYVFTGWMVSNTNDIVQPDTAFTWDYTEDKTLTPNWTQCEACAATNASCELSVVNNTCTYTTSCNTGYGNIQNSGAYNVSCSPMTSHNITYVMNGGTNYAGAPTTYYETVGATIDGVPTRSGYRFVGWCTDAELQICAAPQAISTVSTGDKTFYAKWAEVTAKFTLTTTSVSSFKFKIAAAGTFYVECGDGGTLTGTGVSDGVINRIGDTAQATYTCTWPSAGAHTIEFDGAATGYNTAVDATSAAITFNTTSSNPVASVVGSLGAIFPTLGDTVGETPIFYGTFKQCDQLTTVPATLFSGVTGARDSMFRETFDRCGALEHVPEHLFSGIVNSASNPAPNLFRSTFYSCSSLAEMPAGLFSGVTTASDSLFKYTFYGNTSMTGYIPPTTFKGLIDNNSPTASNMWYGTFTGENSLATSCPPGTTQFITKYEKSWNSKVSCEHEIICEGATYLDNGECVACPDGYTADTTNGKIAASACKIHCDAGTYIANAGDATCTAVGVGYYAPADDVAYGDSETHTACPPGTTTEGSNSTSIDACVWAMCTGATYGGEGQCAACPYGYDANITAGKTLITQCQMGCAGGTVPDTYTPVTYLENSGNTTSGQYINTGYTIKSNNVIINAVIGTAVTRNVSAEYGNLFGNQASKKGFSSSYKNLIIGLWDNSNGNKLSSSVISLTADVQYTIDYTLNGAARTMNISYPGGTTQELSDDGAASINSSTPVHLFSNGMVTNNNDGTLTFTGGDKLFDRGRIYSFVLYDNNVLALDLVPARRNSDNVLGMYNRANGEFYTNAGVGTFNAGPDGTVFAGTTCHNVGDGYYVAANTTNWGGIPATPNKCPNDAPTNKENATSISECDLVSVSCSAGQYLPANTNECATCALNSYCPGGDYGVDTPNDQGITACGAGLYAPTGMWESTQCGHILHIGNDVVYLRATKKTSPAVHVKFGENIFYANMTTADVVMHTGTEHKLKADYGEQTYFIYDDTVDVGNN